ncbi:MAG: prepilin-type N-terminal cleavage/methylation domain-containing protein [Planctomycetota bacterium]
MQQTTRCNKPMHRIDHRSMGFTLVEVLISFGIFAIGAIAVASLFPVAALLQKETVDDVLGKHAAESAKAIVLAKGLTYQQPGADRTSDPGDLDSYHALATSTESRAVPLLANFPALESRFTIWDRSYPTFTRTRSDTAANFEADLTDRDLFWVPFIQDTQGDPNNPVWVMHIFILKGDSRAEWDKTADPTAWANPLDPIFVPGVTGVGVTGIGGNDNIFQLSGGHSIQVGDRVLDTNGISYRVTAVSGNNVTIDGAILTSPAAPTAVYFAPPGVGGDGDSPTLAIITFSSDPNDPDAVQLVSDPTP